MKVEGNLAWFWGWMVKFYPLLIQFEENVITLTLFNVNKYIVGKLCDPLPGSITSVIHRLQSDTQIRIFLY